MIACAAGWETRSGNCADTREAQSTQAQNCVCSLRITRIGETAQDTSPDHSSALQLASGRLRSSENTRDRLRSREIAWRSRDRSHLEAALDQRLSIGQPDPVDPLHRQHP
eukprot:6203945-Pleurochrysis_carterae.AAC.1